MKKACFLLSPLIAIGVVMGQLVETTRRQPLTEPPDESTELPFSTTIQFLLPTSTRSSPKSSRRFAFALTTQKTSVVLPQIIQFNPSGDTTRIRFITISQEHNGNDFKCMSVK